MICNLGIDLFVLSLQIQSLILKRENNEYVYEIVTKNSNGNPADFTSRPIKGLTLIQDAIYYKSNHADSNSLD